MFNRPKWFVGLAHGKRNAFKSYDTPNESSGYQAVIGPFRTKRGAIFMARIGANNPHVRTVDDAERLAKGTNYQPK